MRTFGEFVDEMGALGFKRGHLAAAYTYIVLAIAGFLAFAYVFAKGFEAAYYAIGLWVFLLVALNAFLFGVLAWLIADQEPHQSKDPFE